MTAIDKTIENLKTNNIDDKEIIVYMFLKYNSSNFISLDKLKTLFGRSYLKQIKNLCEKKLLSCNIHNCTLEIENIDYEILNKNFEKNQFMGKFKCSSK